MASPAPRSAATLLASLLLLCPTALCGDPPLERAPNDHPSAGTEANRSKVAILRHWAYVAPVRPELPSVSDASIARNPIDAFVRKKLDDAGMAHNPPASKEIELRRVTFDLTGLPPTLAEIDAYLRDDREGAYESVVNRLLESPRHAERMAKDWLDVVRFGDTHGYHLDNERSIFRYRDWVISAFFENMPFDRFTIEQLAGDLLENPTLDQKIATGFLRCNPTTGEGGLIEEEYLVKYAIDRTETVSTIWLGSTLGCAQCHDHKYDPFTQKEFYQLYAFFDNLAEKGSDENISSPPPVIKAPTHAQVAALAESDAQLAKIRHELFGPLPELDALLLVHKKGGWGAQASLAQRRFMPVKWQRPFVDLNADRTRLEAERAALDAAIPNTLVAAEANPRRPAYFLNRGQYDRKGDLVEPNTPAILPPLPPRASNDRPADRLALANWLVDPKNPLPARVTMNRLWQRFFGVGLVETVEDFGLRSPPPSHPELLDWLAVEFVESGWDLRHMIFLIVTSSTYRESSHASAEQLERDPKNRLLGRGARARLDAEEIRDSALFVSGLLVEHVGGPSVKPYQPDGLWQAVAYPTSNTSKYAQDKGDSLYRRGLYTFWKRTSPPPSLTAFDAPSRERSCVQRGSTNTPLQALALMNDVQYVEASRFFAERMIKEGGASDDDRLAYGYRLATSRSPDPSDVAVLCELLNAQRVEYRANEAAAKQLLTVGEKPCDASLDACETAAFAVVANLLLNLDATITKG